MEKAYTKKSLKSVKVDGLKDILKKEFSYKDKGLEAFDTKKKLVDQIIKLQGEKVPEGPTQAQLDEYAGLCITIGDVNVGGDLEHPNCAACKAEDGYPKGMFDYCASLIAAAKKEAEESKKTGSGSTRTKATFTTFDDLKKHLEMEVEKPTFTFALNRSFLGKGRTLKETLEFCDELRKDYPGNNDMKSVGRIRAHMKYMSTKGWVFSELKGGKFKLTDYNGENNAFPFVEKAEEKAA